jgi:hypothetical protein
LELECRASQGRGIRISAIRSSGTANITFRPHSVRASGGFARYLPPVDALKRDEDFNDMRKTLCAGVLALAIAGVLPGMPVHATEFAAEQGPQASINIPRIKSVLKLSAYQVRYWAPVEAALRDIARHQVRDESEGLVRRVGHRALSIVLTAAAIERLAVAARPLIAVLDDEQRQNARGLAQEMGLGPVVIAALN